MEKLFDPIVLEGEYLGAYESVVDELSLEGAYKEKAKELACMLQIAYEVMKKPLEAELEIAKRKAEVYKEELRYSKISMNALEEENRRLTIENLNLLNCLKAFRDLQAKEDKIKGNINHPDYLDFIRWMALQKQEEAVK